MGKGHGHGIGSGKGVGEGSGEGKGGFFCTGSTLFMILVVFVVGIVAVLYIIFGAVYFDKCEHEPMITTWCIVSGFTPLFLLLFLYGIKDDSYEVTVCRVIAFIGYLAFTGWLIAGSIWIFSTYNENPANCYRIIQRIAFWMCIVAWCLFGIATLALVYTALKIFGCPCSGGKKVGSI